MKFKNLNYSKVIYFFILLISGFILGLYLSKYINLDDQTNLTTYLTVLIDTNNYKNYFISQFMLQIILIIVLLLLGTSIVGYPLISFLIYSKGLQIGFSCVLFITTYSLKGVLGIIFVFIPYIIFDIIAFYIASSYCLNLSLKLFIVSNNNGTLNFKKIINKLLNILIICIVLTIVSSYFKSTIGIQLIKFFKKL